MEGLDPGVPEIWGICHVKALGPQTGVLASSSSMVPHDMLGGNFVVLPPADVFMPHAENQDSRKQGLKAEAKMLGVSAAARVDGLSVGARPQRGQSLRVALGPRLLQRLGGGGSETAQVFSMAAREFLPVCPWEMFS